MSNDFVFNNSTIEERISEYYKYYLDLFQTHTNYLNNKEIYRLRLPDVDCYDKTYFHMITKQYSENKCDCPRTGITCEHPFEYNPWLNLKMPRELCPSRMMATVCLEDFFNKKLMIWETIESNKGQKKRINCFSAEDDYIIVLEERNDGDIYVVTGYPVEFSARREKFIKQYNNYINSKDHTSYKTNTK